MNAIMIQNLKKNYGSFEVSLPRLDLRQGYVTGLVGKNGSGKTTLIRGICSRIPSSGTCRLAGETPGNAKALAQTVSMIPQRTSILFSIPVLDVVLMGLNSRLSLLAQPSAAQRQAARDLLRQVGMDGREEQDFLTLSEGQKQLVILARALMQDTPVLLLDEPDSALDLANRSHMAALLAEFVHASGKTALICLHDPMLMLDWCDTLIVLQNGQVGAMLYPRTDPVEALQSALAAVYGPLELVPVTDRTGRVRLALLPL